MAGLSATLRCAAIAVLLLAVAAIARAQDLPDLTQPVNDLAGVIDAASAATLDARIRALQTTTGDAVVVVTVPTIAPYGSIEEYAVRLFEHAGIGARNQDNGVLVVVAVQDRKVRIEVGYGLEPTITDGFAGETIRQQMLPAFRDGRYGEGLVAGTTRLIGRIADERGVTLTDVPREPLQRPGTPRALARLIPIAITILILIAVMHGGRGPRGGGRRRRSPFIFGPWIGGIGGFGGGMRGGGFGGFGGGGRGGGFGGFGGFGGGRSGGGGASGGW